MHARSIAPATEGATPRQGRCDYFFAATGTGGGLIAEKPR
jgi:hypothetical protein